MIIEARGDVVSLRGTLNENHWDAIAAAVDLLLPDHPQGILMDCGGMTEMTEMGGATFMNGLAYLEVKDARIILCNVPPAIAERLKAVPGLHSQVPTAPTVEAGRKSLDAARSAPMKAQKDKRVMVVAVNPPFSVGAAGLLLSRFHLDTHTEVHFIYAMVVPRSLPLGAPLPDEETRADAILTQAEGVITVPSRQRNLARGRSIQDAILDAAKKLNAVELVIGLDNGAAHDEKVTEIITSLREDCKCTFTLIQEGAA